MPVHMPAHMPAHMPVHMPVHTQVPRNEFGGVLVDEEELKAAFDFFDVNKKGFAAIVFHTCCGSRWLVVIAGVLTPADLKSRLSIFYKNLPAREYKFLISDRPRHSHSSVIEPVSSDRSFAHGTEKFHELNSSSTSEEAMLHHAARAAVGSR